MTSLSATSSLPPCPEVARALAEHREPGVPELCEGLREILDASGSGAPLVEVERIKRGVYRILTGRGNGRRALVVKRHRPALAQADRLVLERWLPALGMEARSPRLLGAAAEREGRFVWHVYEDFGRDTLAVHPEAPHVEAAMDLLAELHTRAAGHAILPEVRWHGRDHGLPFLTSSLRDAIALLTELASPDAVGRGSGELAAACTRLLERLHRLNEEVPRWARLIEEAAGADTLLHGDLGPKNVFVPRAGEGVPARLIDWDHVGVGPGSFDVSTFLYRFPRERRPEILRSYRAAMGRRGRHLPEDGELNLLFYFAESARCAHCVGWPAIALLREGAPWGRVELVEVDRWFQSLAPPLPEEHSGPRRRTRAPEGRMHGC